ITSAGTLAVAGLLVGGRGRTAFTWFAWAMSGVLVTLLASRAGIPAERLDTVVVAWGAGLLIGGALLDRRWHGPPARHEGIRDRRLHAPVAIGALALPIALGPVFTGAPATYGWWAIGVGAAYLGVAALLRIGGASLPGWALMALGSSVLVDTDPFEPAWILPAIAAVLVAAGWLFDLRQSEETRADPWSRWDVPPLAVASVIGILAMSRSFVVETVPETWIGFGLLGLAVGLWRRNARWRDGGNLLALFGGFAAGPPVAAIVLAVTAIRAGVEAERSAFLVRAGYVGATAVAAGVAWIEVIAWQDWTQITATEMSAIVFGALALAVAVAHRMHAPIRWTASLGALATIGTIAAAIATQAGIDSPWPAIGMLAFAIGAGITGTIGGIPLEPLAALATGIAWIEVIAWQDWTSATVLGLTSIGAGGIALAAAAARRFALLTNAWLASWWVVAGVAIVIAWVHQAPDRPEGVLPAAGLVLVCAASVVTAPIIGSVARLVPVGLVPIAWVAGGVGLEWSMVQASTLTSTAFAGVVAVAAMLGRVAGADPDDGPITRVHLIWAWIAMASMVSVAAIPVAGTPGAAREAWGVGAVALAVLSLAIGSVATPLRSEAARPLAEALAVGAWAAAALAIDPDGSLLGHLAVAATVAAVPAELIVSQRGAATPIPPVRVFAGLSAAMAIALGLGLLPETALLAMAMLAVGALLTAVGIGSSVPTLVTLGPVLAFGSWLLGLADIGGATGYLWYTIPIGILVLVEVEIARWTTRNETLVIDAGALLAAEWVGIAVLVASPLAHMVIEGVESALIVFGVAVAILLWSLVTKMRRRFITSLVVTGVGGVMAVAVGAAGGAPASATFWIMLVGTGTSALLTVGIIDGYRSRSGVVMGSFGEMMEDWE
ncbi:MAG TPA: hypothetical protein VLD62_08855, partial [Acidimicrobiia bacterium]|nr:hypothetical protein [Acidimicrobiia bacterium]